jgi:hypothetical protein
MFSDKAKTVVLITTALIISIFASGFIWQHVIPDMEYHYETEIVTRQDGSEVAVGYKKITNGLEWFIFPSAFVLVVLNISLLISLMWVYAEWDKYDAREFLDRVSVSKLLKTGLKKP